MNTDDPMEELKSPTSPKSSPLESQSQRRIHSHHHTPSLTTYKPQFWSSEKATPVLIDFRTPLASVIAVVYIPHPATFNDMGLQIMGTAGSSDSLNHFKALQEISVIWEFGSGTRDGVVIDSDEELSAVLDVMAKRGWKDRFVARGG